MIVASLTDWYNCSDTEFFIKTQCEIVIEGIPYVNTTYGVRTSLRLLKILWSIDNSPLQRDDRIRVNRLVQAIARS